MRLHAVPAFADNLVWLLADDRGRAIAVDPGDAAPVEATLASRGWRLEAILLTHHHHDHIGGAAALAARHGTDIVAPADDLIPIATRRVDDGDVVNAAGTAFRVMAIPAHTRSHIAFVGEQHLFCGDTLFSLGCGRLFEGTPAQLHAALQRLAALPDALAVCCGHEYTEANARFARAVEPDNAAREQWMVEVARRRAGGAPSLPSTVAIERAANPFLRVDAPGVRAGLATRGEDSDDPVERLAALRRWKDGFA
jgi:hydroxyacylglutathione hydrolase